MGYQDDEDTSDPANRLPAFFSIHRALDFAYDMGVFKDEDGRLERNSVLVEIRLILILVPFVTRQLYIRNSIYVNCSLVKSTGPAADGLQAVPIWALSGAGVGTEGLGKICGAPTAISTTSCEFYVR